MRAAFLAGVMISALDNNECHGFTCHIQQVPWTVTVAATTTRTNELKLSKPNYDNYFADLEKELLEEEEAQLLQTNARKGRPTKKISKEYHLASDAGPIAASCPLNESQILEAIALRLNYKRAKNFSKADQILRDLNQAGVYVHDKRQEWRADGLNSFGASESNKYVRRGPMLEDFIHTTEIMDAQKVLADISILVEQRSSAKKQRNFDVCDALEEQLRLQYKVKIDDKRREWSFEVADTTAYVPSPLASKDDPTHTTEDRSKIQQLLRDRAMARQSKNYGQADEIRDELWLTYNVVMDDRTLEWKIMSKDLEEDDDEDDPFLREALASQRSAFARTKAQGGGSVKASSKGETSERDTLIPKDLNELRNIVVADDDVEDSQEQ